MNLGTVWLDLGQLGDGFLLCGFHRQLKNIGYENMCFAHSPFFLAILIVCRCFNKSVFDTGPVVGL